MSIKKTHHVTKEVGLKSALGRIGQLGSSLANRINAISELSTNMCELL